MVAVLFDDFLGDHIHHRPADRTDGLLGLRDDLLLYEKGGLLLGYPPGRFLLFADTGGLLFPDPRGLVDKFKELFLDFELLLCYESMPVCFAFFGQLIFDDHLLIRGGLVPLGA